MHIDFGFFIQISPGDKFFESEKAPFKLTKDYIDLMDGIESVHFKKFKQMVDAGLTEVKRNIRELENMITILAKGKQSCVYVSDFFQILVCVVSLIHKQLGRNLLRD